MLNAKTLRAILHRISYKDWSFNVLDRGGMLFLDVAFVAADVDGEGADVQRGRKWYVSPHATESEVVQTAFLAVKTAEEHELRETFRYRDQLVYGPHFSVDQLHLLARQGGTDSRH